MKKVLTLKKILTFVLAVFMFVPALAFTGCIQDGLDETKPVAKSKYRITLSTSASAAGTVDGAGVYEEGSVITIRAIANSNYTFSKWGDGNTDNPRTITVDSNKSYKAYFNYSGDCEISVTVTSLKQGQIIKDEVYGHVEGVGSYKNGTTATLKAVPEEGCLFVKWNDGCLDAERQITLTTNASFRATFVKADTLYVHEETGYFVAVIGECTTKFYKDFMLFIAVNQINFTGVYEGANELPITFTAGSITVYYSAITKNYFYTMVNSQVGIVTVHAVVPSSNYVEDVKSKEGNKTVDWTYLKDLEEYVKDEGYMMIYFTDFKRTEPSEISEKLNLTMYIYHIDCNKYVNYAMYIVYETSKGLCVDRTDFGSLLNTQTRKDAYYYKGENRVMMQIRGVKN